MFDLKTPLAAVDNSISKTAEFDVAEVLAEFIDSFLCKYRFHKVMAVRHQYLRNDLYNEESHGFSERWRQGVALDAGGLSPVGLQLLL